MNICVTPCSEGLRMKAFLSGNVARVLVPIWVLSFTACGPRKLSSLYGLPT